MLSNFQLTKSDFLSFLGCDKNLWLQKHRPELFPQLELTEYAKKLVDDGYAVEEVAQGLFPNGKRGIAAENIEALDGSVYFQTVFRVGKLYARTDILVYAGNGTWDIIEVKSASSISSDYYYDLAFQKYVLESYGLKINRVYILHCNKDYVRYGELDIGSLFVKVRVNSEVAKIADQVILKINKALAFLEKPSIDETSCGCIYKSKNGHCASFGHFNKGIPEYSIYQLSRIQSKTVSDFIHNGIVSFDDIYESQLSGRKQLEVLSYRAKEPLIDVFGIHKQLANLEYPLYFYDYETYSEAIPYIDGLRPHQHLVFQVSIHKLDQENRISHMEYISDVAEQPEKLLQAMKEFTGMEGTFIVWNKSFENTRNKEMARQLPLFADYLGYVNDHTFDLMEVFKSNYVDYRSKGSVSIKKILPLLCPELSYQDLVIQEGTAAQEGWRKLVFEKYDESTQVKMKNELLAYCKLDTWAMIRIYEELGKLI